MTLFVERFGDISRPRVVILHGAPTSLDHMRPLAVRLGQTHHSLLVHLPGYGRSAALQPYRLDRAHSVLEETLLGLDVPEADFVGFSGGTYRSFALAHRRRVSVKSIAALGAAANFTEEEAAGLHEYARLLRAGVEAGPILEQIMLSARGREMAGCVKDVHGWLQGIEREHLARELEAFATAPDLRPMIAELEIPILFRVGAADASTPPERSKRILPFAKRATYQEVPDVGHAMLCEDFEGTASAVEAFLRSVKA